MAKYSTTVDSTLDPEKAFEYLADFTNATEWDPNTTSSVLITEDPLAVGAKYEVVTKFAGREMELVYETVELSRPDRVVIQSGNGSTDLQDTMTFAPSPNGTRVTYEANVTPKGLVKLIDPLLTLIFKRVGDRAAEGLRKALKADQVS